jgi:hypothetical protein
VFYSIVLLTAKTSQIFFFQFTKLTTKCTILLASPLTKQQVKRLLVLYHKEDCIIKSLYCRPLMRWFVSLSVAPAALNVVCMIKRNYCFLNSFYNVTLTEYRRWRNDCSGCSRSGIFWRNLNNRYQFAH